MKPRFTIKTLLLVCALIGIIVAIWARNHEIKSHARSVHEVSCTPHYGYVLPRSLGWLFGFHFAAGVTEVQLRYFDFQPGWMRPQMIQAGVDDRTFETLRELPHLETVWVFDDSNDRQRYAHAKLELPNIDVINVMDFPNAKPSQEHGIPFSIMHAIGIVTALVSLNALRCAIFNAKQP